MKRLVFIDTETTGLDPDRHEIWEVGVVVREEPSEEERTAASRVGKTIDTERAEYLWQLPVDLSRADPIALNIGRFFDRRGPTGTTSYFPGLDAFDQSGEISQTGQTIGPKVVHPGNMPWWCDQFARLTWGAHLVGAVVSFDADRLARLLRKNFACGGWHYHLIDVEALAVGFAIGRCHGMAVAGDITRYGGAVDAAHLARTLPWDSSGLSRAVGVDPDQFDKHTALGDARWAEAVYDAVHHPRGSSLASPTPTGTDPGTVTDADRCEWVKTNGMSTLRCQLPKRHEGIHLVDFGELDAGQVTE